MSMDHYDDHPVEVMRSEYEAFKGFVQQTVAERQMAELAQYTAQQEAAYRQQAQDYDNAVAHLHRALLEQVKTGYGVNDQQAAHLAQGYVMEITSNAVRSGRNPADVAYQLAKNYGYKPPEPPTAVDAEVKEYDAFHKAKGTEIDGDLKAEMDALWSKSNGSDEEAQLDKIWAEMEKEHYNMRFR